jgi:hypothetical protein
MTINGNTSENVKIRKVLSFFYNNRSLFLGILNIKQQPQHKEHTVRKECPKYDFKDKNHAFYLFIFLCVFFCVCLFVDHVLKKERDFMTTTTTPPPFFMMLLSVSRSTQST